MPLSGKLWGGRFNKSTDKVVEAFTESISFDYRLIEFDIKGSIAHAKMLGKCGIISVEDSAKIIDGLNSILADYIAGKIEFDPAAEDIHMNVEKILKEKIGESAGRLHTARSRNDQVATDIRLFLKDSIDQINGFIIELQNVIVEQAEKHSNDIIPGYTHLQHAQPIILGHHLMAYFWMLQRDKERFLDCYKRIDVLGLGSGALAGTTFPIDRQFTAKELGFNKVSENSIDSVADRDFAAEFISACAIAMVHLSRFAEELVIWNSSEFSFVELDDSVTTGSSIMPQKKNPDAAELTRGKSARVIGDLMSILTLQKGLPLAYNRDMQEDKEPIFDACDTLMLTLQVFGIMLKSAKFNIEKMHKSAGEAFSTATDLADYLVRKNVTFRDAHEQVGSLVAYCIKNNKELWDLSVDEIKQFTPSAGDDIRSFLTVEASVSARSAYGGTAKSEVLRQIDKAKYIIINGEEC